MSLLFLTRMVKIDDSKDLAQRVLFQGRKTCHRHIFYLLLCSWGDVLETTRDKRNFVVKKYSWGVITSADNIYSDCIRNVMKENEKKVFSRWHFLLGLLLVIAKWLLCGFEIFPFSWKRH